jgi:ATP-binding cassette subfamily B protein
MCSGCRSLPTSGGRRVSCCPGPRPICNYRFIADLPDGYETGGSGRLSAGQRQLIALARVLIADPSVVILDEATSSLDIPTERLIHDAMRTVLAGRTALLIAHRPATIRIADRVLVMSDGQIIEDRSSGVPDRPPRPPGKVR